MKKEIKGLLKSLKDTNKIKKEDLLEGIRFSDKEINEWKGFRKTLLKILKDKYNIDEVGCYINYK